MSGKTDGDDREHAATITGAGAQHLAAELAERAEFLADAATLDSDLADKA